MNRFAATTTFVSLSALAMLSAASAFAADPPTTTPAVSIASTAKTATAAPLQPTPTHRMLRVAVFEGGGTSDSRNTVIAALRKDVNLKVDDISTGDILAGKLANYDVIVQPGGSGSGQAKALGEDGRAKVKAYVNNGGGYLGICGGSYLASDDYPWSLGILNAKVLDKEHWARGHGPVDVIPTADGKKVLGADADHLTIIYWQGPIMAPAGDPKLPAYAEWAKFGGEVHRAGVPGGVMPGQTAIAAAPFGKGRVVCFSPHAEKTDGQETLLHHALLWITASQAANPASVAAATTASMTGLSAAPPTTAGTSASTPFTRIVLSHFDAWDADHDGTLSVREIENLVRDPKITGDDAAAVATLDMLGRGSKTVPAPAITREYLNAYAAEVAAKLHSPLYPTYQTRFETCVKRIRATPNTLFVGAGTPEMKSVCQGMIGDCFFVSVVGAMLNRDPTQVKSMIHPRPDGSSEVVFPAGQRAHVLPITDAEVALSGNSLGTGRWLATLESGFANIRRDMRKPESARAVLVKGVVAEPDPAVLATDIIRTGGSMHEVIEFLTGHAIGHVTLRGAGNGPIPPASTQEAKLPEIRVGVTEALRDHRLVGTGTTGAIRPQAISGNHAYAITGYDAATDRITLWNPHGNTFTPTGTPGLANGYPTTNGVFSMPLIEFAQVFEAVNWELPTPSKTSAMGAGTPEVPEQ